MKGVEEDDILDIWYFYHGEITEDWPLLEHIHSTPNGDNSSLIIQTYNYDDYGNVVKIHNDAPLFHNKSSNSF